MTEPNESSFASEESEALSVANDIVGDDSWQVEEGGADSSQDLSEPAPSGVTSSAPQSPAQPSLTLEQARQAWNQQTATRAQLREHANQQFLAAQQAQSERARYEEMANAILRAQAQQQQQKPEDQPQIDPDLQRYFDAQQQQLLERVQGMLSPVLSQAQQAQQMQEIQQQVSQEQGQWNEVREIVSRAEADYMATPEGQGYNDRVGGYEQAMRTALTRSGLNEQATNKLVTEQLKGFTMLGMALNVPPPVLLDNYINSVIEFAMTYRSGNGNGRTQSGNGYRQPAQQRQQARISPNVQVARMATQSGAVGAPPSGGANTPNGLVTAGDLLGRGLTGKDIETLTKELGSLDKAIRYLERQAMELEQIEG